jgi:PAS domain S-box-containing protein
MFRLLIQGPAKKIEIAQKASGEEKSVSKDRETSPRLRELRRRAQELISREGKEPQEAQFTDARKLVEELHTYQIELEMQNEELLRANLDLEEARTRYLELYDFAPIAYITISPEGKITTANLAAAQLLGVDRRHLIKMVFSRFVKPEFRDTYYSCLTTSTRSNMNKSCGLQLLSSDGSVIYAQLEIMAVRTESEKTSQVRITISDITPAKKAAEQLTQSELEFRSLFEQMIAGAAYFKVLTDRQDRPKDLVYIQVNEAFELMTGLKKEEVVGKHITEIFHDIRKLDFDWIENLGKVAVSGESISFEQYFEPLSRWFSGSAYRPQEGYCAVIFSDITGLKQTEEDLKQAKKELEIKNEGLEAFVYTAAHDLRTPLASAQGFFQLVSRRISGKLGEDEKEMMERVTGGLRSLDSLLGDLLEFSQMEERTEPPDTVNLEPIIRRVEEEERQMFRNTDASISVEENLPPVLIHKTRCYQLFKNIISNSLKYAREDVPLKIEITLSSEGHETVPPDCRVFIIKDNGIGIDKKHLERIFELFVRDQDAVHGGSGVGLAIVKRIIDLEKGKIWVKSRVGKGTTFYIALPVAE